MIEWYFVRASGLLALALLAGLTLTGLAMPGRLAGFLNRKLLFSLHEKLAVAAALTGVAHGLSAVLDGYVHIPPLALVLPGASRTLPGPVALGTLAGWGLAAVAGSSWLRKDRCPGAVSTSGGTDWVASGGSTADEYVGIPSARGWGGWSGAAQASSSSRASISEA